MEQEPVRVARSAEVTEGRLTAVDAAGRRVLLSRVNGEVRAVLNACPHMGFSMGRGTIDAGVIRCPWHGSRFDFCTGRNLDWVNAFAGVPLPKWTHGLLAMGKTPAPLTTVATEERDGEILVRLPAA